MRTTVLKCLMKLPMRIINSLDTNMNNKRMKKIYQLFFCLSCSYLFLSLNHSFANQSNITSATDFISTYNSVIANYTIETEEAKTDNKDEKKKSDGKYAKNTKYFIRARCTAVLQNKELKRRIDRKTQFLFDAQQSAFVYHLCSPLFEKEVRNNLFNENFTKKENPYIKQADRKRRDLTCEFENSNLNDCDLGDDITKIYDHIMSDISTARAASSYGVNQRPDKADQDDTDPEKEWSNRNLANEFGRYYFNNLVLCDINNTNDPKCRFATAHQKVKEQIKKAKKMIRSNNYIDAQSIMQVKKSDKQNTQGCYELSKEDYDLFKCGIVGDKTHNPDEAQKQATQSTLLHFNNLIYNETFRYKLFSTHYAYLLFNNNALQSFNNSQRSKTDTKGNIQAQRLSSDIQARQQVVRQLGETIATIQNRYPIHVGLLLYSESLLRLRSVFVNLYTPINQLYYKLRNVQKVV